MQETSSELTGKVKNWLLTHGYPLEMRVARAANQAGLFSALGSYYYDQELDVHREIDVEAVAEPIPITSKHRGIQIRVAFECKSGIASSKPWVVLTADEIAFPGSMVAQRYVTDALKEWWMRSADYVGQCRLRALGSVETFGYSLVRAQLSSKREERERDDQAFAALMQASKGAFGICRKLNEVNIPALVLPVVVVDTPLFSCRLNSKEELDVEEIESATLIWGNRLSLDQPVTTIIDVMRESAVPEYARSVNHAAHTIADLATKQPPPPKGSQSDTKPSSGTIAVRQHPPGRRPDEPPSPQHDL